MSEPYLRPGFIRNSWYVAAWSDEVDEQALFPRTLLGQPILLFRDSAGQIVAFHDQCCHRAAPLSLGRKEGNCIRCQYHGMKFDTSGKCVEIPGQDIIPEQARVRTYPVVERDRFIWIWMGDPEKADATRILDFFWHEHAEWRLRPGYIHYQANYQLVVDNLLDFSHLSFVHPMTLGTTASAETRSEVTRIDEGLKITRWDYDSEMSPNHKRVAGFAGKVDRWQIYEWHPPGFLRMDAGSAPVGSGAPEGRRVPESIQFRHTSVQTPETESTTHYFFCQARNFKLDDEAMTDAIFADVQKAFGEDRAVIEAQQRILNMNPHFKPTATMHDKGLNQARHLIQRLLAQESTQKSSRPESLA